MPTDEKISAKILKAIEPEGLKPLKFTKSAASSSLPNEGSKVRASGSAIDGDIQTSWQEGSDGYGEGEWIVVSFDAPKTVYCFDLYLGNWRVPKDGIDFFENNCRPKRMTMIANGKKYTMTFSKEKFMQRLTFDEPVTAAEFKFTIEEVYPGLDEYHDCCISEILAYARE
ncbi:MAG: discoidin domain-containing protein [Lachnospiraceae bacterium]